MWGHPSSWAVGGWVGGGGPEAAAEGPEGPAAPLAGLDPAALAGMAPQGPTPLLHSASSVPAPATIWVPDGPAAATTLGAFPPRPAHPAASAPLPTWLPPSPFSVFDSGTGTASALPSLRPASAPLPTLSPFSSGGFESGAVSDAAHVLQPATLGPALRGLPSSGFDSVTSPVQLSLQPSAASPPPPQGLQLASVLPDALGGTGSGLHQPMLPAQPPSPPLATMEGVLVTEDEDPLMRYLLEDNAFAAESPIAAEPAAPPAPRPLGPSACLVRVGVVPAWLAMGRWAGRLQPAYCCVCCFLPSTVRPMSCFPYCFPYKTASYQ